MPVRLNARADELRSQSLESDLSITPPSSQWPELIVSRPGGAIFGRSQPQWREISRRELGLDIDRPIIATGHQTLLWHPGILAKYLAAEAFARANNVARANLIVDQHAEGFGEFEIPIRRSDGSLGVRTVELCRPRPRKDVPMGRHDAFTPPRVPENFSGAIPSVNEGVRRIFDAVYAHRHAPNAALQMAEALADLMQWGGWVHPMPNVTSTDLIATSFARAVMQEMAKDPWRCAECYNRAAASVPEGRIAPLMIREDYVELPLWRIRGAGDGRRMHAYDNDVEDALANPNSKLQAPKSAVDLLPRALFMTALVRLCMCDLFIHGTGGALYDRAMELWIKDWLGITVGSIAVVTATLRLPLLPNDAHELDVETATVQARRLWHNPESHAHQNAPGSMKARALREIEKLPRRSSERKAAFLQMHERLNEVRAANKSIQEAQEHAERAKRQAADISVARRRDWAFPLYPKEMIDELAQMVGRSARLLARG